MKWKAFQDWRFSFAAEHGREPNIWFDKACIDQNDVQADLRGLPIFLYGCKELLILCGPTYLQRLWCVVELFTFVHIGGKLHQIKMVPLCRDAAGEEDRDAILRTIENFDAEQCACFDPSDKERMLEIIVAAFGCMESFNTVLHALMRQARLGEKSTAQQEKEAIGIGDNLKSHIPSMQFQE